MDYDNLTPFITPLVNAVYDYFPSPIQIKNIKYGIN